MPRFVVSILLCMVVSYATAQQGDRCPAVAGREKETCVCQHPDGIIDVTPLGDKNGPKYTGLTDINKFVYSYNPCYPYSVSGGCTEVHCCQSPGDDPDTTYDIADAGTEMMWIDNDGTPYIYYSALDDLGQLRHVYAYLNCDPDISLKNTEVTTVGDSDPDSFLVYKIYIKSCQVCPGGCIGGGGGSTAGLVGILLIIFALIGLAAYFIVGAVIMKVRYQATGSDIIPNKAFWVALPGLIKDGCGCTFGPPYRFIRGKIKGDSGYESMKA